MAESRVDGAADLAVLMAKTEAAAKRREDSWTRGVRIIVAEAVLAAGYATPAQVEQVKREARAEALAGLAEFLEELLDDDEDEPNADYGNGRLDAAERALREVRTLLEEAGQ